MSKNLDYDQIVSVLRNEALDDSEHGWLSDLNNRGLKWSENDHVIWFDWMDGSVDVGHLAEIVEHLIETATKPLLDRAEKAEQDAYGLREGYEILNNALVYQGERLEQAEAAVQRVEDVLSKDAFSVQEDGFCADDLVDCEEIRTALKGPTKRQLQEAEKALRELHEEVWTNDPAPGGFVCKGCGVPVESEPCDAIRALDGGEQA